MRKGQSKHFLRIPNVYSLHSLYMLREKQGRDFSWSGFLVYIYLMHSLCYS